MVPVSLAGGEAPIGTIEIDGAAVPVTVDAGDIDPTGDHIVTVLARHGRITAVTDRYASRPQGMSRCQAGSERYLRLIDIVARVQRYAMRIESCTANIGAADEPITWSADGKTMTVNLVTAPPITLAIAANGMVRASQ